MESSIQRRLMSIMQQKGLTSAQLADDIGVQRSSISHILSGRNKPSIDFIEKLLLKYPEIDTLWLITGRQKNNQLPDLFSQNTEEIQLNVVNLPVSKSIEANEAYEEKKIEQINIVGKKIVQVITFYSDKSCSVYIPD